MEPISIVIPVSSDINLNKWLPEMLKSIGQQTQQLNEVVLIDDGVGADSSIFLIGNNVLAESGYVGPLKIWVNPWPIGLASCFNFGVALASHNLVILACAQDMLLPDAVAQCRMTWRFANDPLAYYNLLDKSFRVAPAGGVMVTKDLWERIGGIPILYGDNYTNQAFLKHVVASRAGFGPFDVVGGKPSYWIRPIETKVPHKFLHAAQVLIDRWMVQEWEPSQPGHQNSGQDPLPEGEPS